MPQLDCGKSLRIHRAESPWITGVCRSHVKRWASMALHLLPSETLRTKCRQRLEACEFWLRRLIHDKLHAKFGDSYIEAAQVAGQTIFRTEIRKHVSARLLASPDRYTRPVDALLLDQLASVICKMAVYKKYFREPFQHGFPLGNDQLRIIMGRLVPIRNAPSHGNPLVLHDAERVLCYCSDIIDSLTHYYATVGMAQDFDAPLFTRFSNSFGHVEHPASTKVHLSFTNRTVLRAGQSIRMEVEIDAHYSASNYVVKWQVANIAQGEWGHGTAFQLTLGPRHVSSEFSIMVTLTSNREWHRYGNYDAIIFLLYKVLPPV